MGERGLAALRLGDTVVATYRDGADLDPVLSPRPYLHPVRTLAGTLVSDALPADHPWHLGICVAIQDVDGWIFWGGPTYVRGQGYVARDDHGRIEHEEFERVDGDGFVERLRLLRTPPSAAWGSGARGPTAGPARATAACSGGCRPVGSAR